MGLLRFILAISVVIAHSGAIFSFKVVGGVVAVQIFFIISGFYMTMILNKKYVGVGSYYLFFTNRLLRLFPLYLVVLLLTLLASITSGIIFENWGRLTPYIINFDLYNLQTLLYLIMTNILLFGQDIVMFMGIEQNTGSLFFTNNFQETSPRLHKFLFVPQAWSIGIELLFYTVAPFIVRKSPIIIIAFILVSLILRVFIYFILGWINDPWTYRFFPTELVLFLFGSLAFHFYKFLNMRQEWIKYQKPIIIIYMLLIIGYQFILIDIPYFSQIKNWSYYLCSIIAIPYLFQATKSLKVDNFIGELSYPIYLIHMLVLSILVHPLLGSYKSMVVIIFSIIISILLVKYIDEPVERFRQSRVAKKRI